MNPALRAVTSISLQDVIDAIGTAADATDGEIGERLDRLLIAARQLRQDIDDLATDELH